jgi:hypothetical protein
MYMETIAFRPISPRETFYKRANAFALVTISYNFIEGVASVLFGCEDGVVTLFGFASLFYGSDLNIERSQRIKHPYASKFIAHACQIRNGCRGWADGSKSLPFIRFANSTSVIVNYLMRQQAFLRWQTQKI